MTTEDTRWRRTKDLFHAAIEHDASTREAFLDQACGSDVALRDEVRALLRAHGSADAFLETPAHPPSMIDAAVPGPPLVVGHYQIERVIGRGGMGVVYLAYDTKLRRQVALKAVSPDYVHDEARRERLRREARAAAALTHPGIAVVYALEEFGAEMFIATEYLPGETLRDEIGRGPASPAAVLETGLALSAALAAAHDRGVIHRDLKPENVIRTADGGVKILDFGLAQMRADEVPGPRLTADGRVIGTPAYMAPEQIRGEACDGRADIFALGVLLYELLTGVHPFAGSDPASTIARILETEPASQTPTGSAESQRLAQELGAIIRRCLAKAPSARFSSAQAVQAALELVRRGESWQSQSRAAEPAVAMRWWAFHQAATCICYATLMLPLWWARALIGGRPGRLIFLAGLIATVSATVLRLHLWFAASSLPNEWRAQRDQSHPWLRTAELALVAVLAVAGLWVIDDHPLVTAILLPASVAVFLSFTVIEPATTRAAFRNR